MAGSPVATSIVSPATQSTALRQIAIDAPNFGGYKPLDPSRREIRLLDLNADSTCHIRHVSLNDRPDYFALSYYWGPPAATRTLILDGEKLQVRKTLHQFLKSLVHLFGSLTVWLDVICINQRLAAEQSSQVAMMGDIYTQAQAVYSWLGKGDPDVDFAMHYINSSDRALWTTNYQRMALAGIEQIFLRRYWTRVWIIQECSLNTRTALICGKMEADLDQLIEAFNDLSESLQHCNFGSSDPIRQGTNLQNPPDPDEPGLSANGLAARQIRPIAKARTTTASVSRDSLLDNTYTFRHCDCQDPKDRIYGFRAISNDGELLSVDYTSSVFDIVLKAISLQNQNSFVYWIETKILQRRFGDLKAAPGDAWYRDGPTKGMRPSGNGFLGIISDCLALCQRLHFPIHQIDRQSLADDPDDWLVIPLREVMSSADSYTYKLHRKCFTITPSQKDPERPAIQILVDPLMKESLEIYMPPASGLHARVYGRFARIVRGHIWLCQLGFAVHLSRFLVLVLMELEQSNWQSLPDYLSQYESRDPLPENRQCSCKFQAD